MKSLSLFIGTGQCNAKCNHCAGVPLRQFAPKKDGVIDEELIVKTIKNCHEKGARYLSISSSGEPTLSPLSITKVLDIIVNNKVKFNPINLYSNGIRIGKDLDFANNYLPLWKNKGLTTIYITVHSANEDENARLYGISDYPSLESIVYRIKSNGLMVRANLILSKSIIDTADKFISNAERLFNIGVDTISTWQIRKLDDSLDTDNILSANEVNKIASWIESSGFNVRLLKESNRRLYDDSEKLTLFQNGVLSNTWCN